MSPEVWPGVFDRAVTALRRKGVSAVDAEDAVQEAISRAVARDVFAADANDMLRWVNKVAWRVVIDRRRRDVRLVYDVPETAGVDNTELLAEHRDLVERVQGSLSLLSDADREALVDVRAVSDRRESVRLAVRRHRARARLMALVEGVAAFVPGLAVLRGRLRGHGRLAAAAAAAGASAFVLATPLAPHSAGEAPSAPPALRKVAVGAAPVAAGVSPTASRQQATVASTPPAPSAPAHFKAHIPGVAGTAPTEAELRPRTAADHDVCADLRGLEPICLDLPPLFGPAK